MDRANDAVLLVGRLLMAALFLPSGISKAVNFGPFAASLADKGLPYAEALAGAAVAVGLAVWFGEGSPAAAGHEPGP
jgi:putative oxidoreductase